MVKIFGFNALKGPTSSTRPAVTASTTARPGRRGAPGAPQAPERLPKGASAAAEGPAACAEPRGAAFGLRSRRLRAMEAIHNCYMEAPCYASFEPRIDDLIKEVGFRAPRVFLMRNLSLSRWFSGCRRVLCQEMAPKHRRIERQRKRKVSEAWWESVEALNR